MRDPAKYNHRLLEVSGFVGHSFENFTFLTYCKADTTIWLEYGGDRGSDTMICCGIRPEEERPGDLEVEGFKIPMLRDKVFDDFNTLMKKEYNTIIKATVTGRFFSGTFEKFSGGNYWLGYGHMGSGSLLAIQQIISFEPHNRTDVDYLAEPGHPGLEKLSCYDIVENEAEFEDMAKIQKGAEKNGAEMEFEDPGEAARRLLSRIEKLDTTKITGLKLVNAETVRAAYEWRFRNRLYFVTVSKPYLLTFIADDPGKIVWIANSAYRAC